MINRLGQYERATDATSNTKTVEAQRSTLDWKQWLGTVEEFIVEHPRQTLVSALVVGVALGWLVKRR